MASRWREGARWLDVTRASRIRHGYSARSSRCAKCIERPERVPTCGGMIMRPIRVLVLSVAAGGYLLGSASQGPSGSTLEAVDRLQTSSPRSPRDNATTKLFRLMGKNTIWTHVDTVEMRLADVSHAGPGQDRRDLLRLGRRGAREHRTQRHSDRRAVRLLASIDRPAPAAAGCSSSTPPATCSVRSS